MVIFKHCYIKTVLVVMDQLDLCFLTSIQINNNYTKVELRNGSLSKTSDLCIRAYTDMWNYC